MIWRCNRSVIKNLTKEFWRNDSSKNRKDNEVEALGKGKSHFLRFKWYHCVRANNFHWNVADSVENWKAFEKENNIGMLRLKWFPFKPSPSLIKIESYHRNILKWKNRCKRQFPCKYTSKYSQMEWTVAPIDKNTYTFNWKKKQSYDWSNFFHCNIIRHTILVFLNSSSQKIW